MAQKKKFAQFETQVGKYSHRKIPNWHKNQHDWNAYLDALLDDDTTVQPDEPIKQLA